MKKFIFFPTYAFAKINRESFVPNVHPTVQPTVQPTWYMRGRTIRSWCQSLRLPKQCGKNYRFWTVLPKVNWHDFKEGDQVGLHVNNLTPNWNAMAIFVSTRGDFNFILPSLPPPPHSYPYLCHWEDERIWVTHHFLLFCFGFLLPPTFGSCETIPLSS